ncbi:hypothetical protein PAMA_015845 [Pampus argenteus]
MMSSFRSGSSSMSLSSLPTGSRRARISGGSSRSVRMSRSSGSVAAGFDLSSALGGGGGSYGSVAVAVSDKVTMQNLNDRLASYLEKVRFLESANAKLELQIREWYAKQTPTVRDYSRYEGVIADLRLKISAATQNNTMLLLQLDNAKLAVDDFKIKFESELEVRRLVEMDIANLRKVLDELTMVRSDLEMRVEGLKEELVYMRKNHTEELDALRGVISSVNVEVDAVPQVDLSKILAEIRSQYEGIADKSRLEIETWFKTKSEDLQKQVVTSTTILQTTRSEITELSRTLQTLQIELQAQLSQKSALEGQLAETESHYSLQLSQLQVMVNNLEAELSQMIVEIERQSTEYQVLLDIKTRLELEIAEYRRLLDGDYVKQTVVQKVVIQEEVKPQPIITQRRRVVIEELVDGVVVSRSEDVDVETVK